MGKPSETRKSASANKKSPMDTAGMIIRTSSGRTFGQVTTFSGQRDTQKVFDSFLTRSSSSQGKLGN